MSGAPTDPDALAATDAGRAKALVVLADAPQDPISDAVTMDVLARARALAEAAGNAAAPPMVVECVDDRNRPRLIAAGAVAAVRPLRTYPEMLARALVTPGAERLLEDLFTPHGNELHRVLLDRPWRGRWVELAYAVLRADIGTAIAYEAPDGGVVMNPGGREEVVASALFLIQHDRQEPLLAARLPGVLRAALAPGGEPPAAAPTPALRRSWTAGISRGREAAPPQPGETVAASGAERRRPKR
jgi:voltage-gated potassium channel